jgi:hypothetical protein
MKHFNRFLLIVILIFPLTVDAGQIKKVFGDGIFGVKWGSTIDQVEEAHPGGKRVKEFGYTQYIIKDGRTILGVERKNNNPITFFFDDNGRLINVQIDFPNPAKNFGLLINKINTVFGSDHITYPGTQTVSQAAVHWKPDEGVTLSLSQVPGIISIGRLILMVGVDLEPESNSKKSLGFE